MGRKQIREDLSVYSNESLVGTYAKLATGATTFQYAKEWMNSSTSHSISRSLPMATDSYRGTEVANFFDNLLPDNDAIRKVLAQKSNAKSDRTFDLLSAIGRDCVGSLLLVPESEGFPAHAKKMSSRAIDATEIAKILKNLGKKPFGFDLEEEFRISIAGAQEKTAFLKTGGVWHVPHGATPTTHIFKVPMGLVLNEIDMSDSVENEWLCLQIFEAFGLDVARAQIHLFEDRKALVIERFDRVKDGRNIKRVHQEDFCQALGLSSSLKYQSDGGPGFNEILNVLLESRQAAKDRRSFMKAQVMNWLIGAPDGHAKNFSVYIQRDGIKLTPFYDVMSAYPLVKKKRLDYQRVKLAMRISKSHYKVATIARRHFMEAAKEAKFSAFEMRQILDQVVDEFDGAIDSVKSNLPAGFPEPLAAAIFEGMRMSIGRLANI